MRVSHIFGVISGLKRNIWRLSDGRHADSYYRESVRANGWKKLALRMKVDCLFDRKILEMRNYEEMRNGASKLFVEIM